VDGYTVTVELEMIGAQLKELLRITRTQHDEFTSMVKWQRRVDAQLETLTDEARVQSAMLLRLEHAVARLDKRIEE
jgi:hypothetical protein